MEDKVYVVQTSPKVVELCLLMTTDPGDLCLDPTCGGGTTAYVAGAVGPALITCDTSRVALALARTRLMAAKYPYYLLADSPDGAKKEMESLGSGSFGETTNVVAAMTMGDIRKGSVYNRVPHVTLKSIANNEEIDAIHACGRRSLSRSVPTSTRRWVRPGKSARCRAELPAAKTFEVSEALRRSGPTRYDCTRRSGGPVTTARPRSTTSIRRAETETLYDQPYEDNKRVRVSEPFTVESLSPAPRALHRR